MSSLTTCPIFGYRDGADQKSKRLVPMDAFFNAAAGRSVIMPHAPSRSLNAIFGLWSELTAMMTLGLDFSQVVCRGFVKRSGA